MIEEIELFISEEKAKLVIAKSADLFKPAKLLGKHVHMYRTAENVFLAKDDLAVKSISQSLSFITNIPVKNQESPQIVKYNEGGEYKEHYDFFHPTESYYNKAIARGGQRIKSCLIYLNEDFEGGETKFIKLDKLIKPKTGKLLIWDNINSDGTLNYDSLHAGLPVKSGVKYILIIWIRENKFS